MSLSSIEFILQETAANIYRNRLQLLAAVSTVAVTLTILGAFIFSVTNLTRLANTIPNQFEIVVHLKDDATRRQETRLRDKLAQIPGIKQIRFRSKEEVFAEQKKLYGTSVNFDGIEMNPQTDEFRMRVANIGNTSQIVSRIGELQKSGESQAIDEIVAAQDEARKLSHLIDFLRYAGIFVTLLLIAASALIISNALRLTIFARRREIRIMQLVGATNWFIRVPYILEGMFHGLVGAALAALAVKLGGDYLSLQIQSQIQFIGRWQTPAGAGGMLLALGALLGATGSFISIRRFLKV